MIDDLLAAWESLPTWVKIAAGVTALLLIDAISMAWGERNFIAGVAEAFVAKFLYYASPLAAISAGAFTGVHTFRKTRIMWLAWGSGIATAMAGGLALTALLNGIPGVSWRLDVMRESNCYIDWDGRANPSVCELVSREKSAFADG